MQQQRQQLGAWSVPSITESIGLLPAIAADDAGSARGSDVRSSPMGGRRVGRGGRSILEGRAGYTVAGCLGGIVAVD